MTATATVTPVRTKALIGALTVLVAAVALCADRVHNGHLYLNLLTGRFISTHGLVAHEPFPTIAHGQSWLNQQWMAELAFFFQAEDGIRDYKVTGVQTCALPI